MSSAAHPVTPVIPRGAATVRARCARWLPWLLAALLALNFAAGIFPFSPVEGDEQGIVNGLNEMVRGATDYYGLRYDYEFQSGTYQIVLALHSVFGGDVAAIYFVLSASCAVAVIALSAWLIADLAAVPFAWALCLALLCQELMTAAYYANTSTVGAFWALLGLGLLLRAGAGRTVAAGVCLGLAGWCRIDSLMLAPAALVLTARRTGYGPALRRTAWVAAISSVALTLLLLSVGLTWPRVWHHFAELRDTVGVLGYGFTLANLHYETSLVLTACAVAGLVVSCVRRDGFIGAFFVSVAIPGAYVHGDYLASPKYLYYLAPVLATCAAVALRTVLSAGRTAGWEKARVLAGLVVVALAAEYLTAPRTSTAAFRRFTPAPTCATLVSFRLGAKPANWVVGPGEVVPNADGFRVRAGYGFAPWVWRREKQSALTELARLRTVIGRPREYAILAYTYLGHQCALGELRARGFRWVETQRYPGSPDHHADRWERGGERCWLVWINHSPDDVAAFAYYADRFGRMPRYFFNDLGELAANRLFDRAAPEWRQLSPRADGLLTLYERR